MKEDAAIEIVESLFRLAKLVREEMADMGSVNSDVSILQLRALFYLSKVKKVNMSDVASHFGVEMSSATSLLNKLCDQDLVKREVDPKDRRGVVVSLTSKGKRMLSKTMIDRRDKLERLLSYLSLNQKKNLLDIIKTLNNKLKTK